MPETIEVWKVTRGDFSTEEMTSWSAIVNWPGTRAQYIQGRKVKPPDGLGPVMAFETLAQVVGFAMENWSKLNTGECSIWRCTAEKVRPAPVIARIRADTIKLFWQMVEVEFDGNLDKAMRTWDAIGQREGFPLGCELGWSPSGTVWAEGLVPIESFGYYEAKRMLKEEDC